MSQKNPKKILSFFQDYYKGATIDYSSLPKNLPEFQEAFEETLAHFLKNKFKAIWIKIRPDQAEFISYLHSKHGFGFHHATAEYLMMNKWLGSGPSRLPLGPTHQIGVGSIIIHPEKEEILAIKENHGPAQGFWKIPGGLVDPFETLEKAAVREVKEETGIDSKFLGFAGMREVPVSRMAQGDMYFIAILQPTSFEINRAEEEIQEAKWMPIEKYIEATKRFPVFENIILNIKDNLPYRIKEGDPNSKEKEKKFKETVLSPQSFILKVADREFKQIFHATQILQIPKL